MAKKEDRFKPEERAAIRALLIGIKRLWNAPADSKEENRAVELLIDTIESVKGID